MKRLLILFSVLLGVASCQSFDVWNWEGPENTFSETVFPSEGVLTLVSSADSRITANLSLSVHYDYSGDPAWDAVEGVEIRFDLVDAPCKVTRNKAHLYADVLPGTVRIFKSFYGYDKGSTVSISGNYSFDVKLDRSATDHGWDSRLCTGDRLHGNWIIRFESEKGERLYFKITDVDVRSAH